MTEADIVAVIITAVCFGFSFLLWHVLEKI
jgi:hypothetical protein